MFDLTELGIKVETAIVRDTFTVFRNRQRAIAFTKTGISCNAALCKDIQEVKNMSIFPDIVIFTKEPTKVSYPVHIAKKQYSGLNLRKNANELVGEQGSNYYWSLVEEKRTTEYIMYKVVDKRKQPNKVVNKEY
jgi:hypothetical protein